MEILCNIVNVFAVTFDHFNASLQKKEAVVNVEYLLQVSVKFWFATGGAGFCISRGLALKMSPWAR